MEVSYVTCWEDPTQIVLATEICLGLLIWLQDGLLVSGSMQYPGLGILIYIYQLYRFWVLTVDMGTFIITSSFYRRDWSVTFNLLVMAHS